jgi:hypothetical protein
MLTSSLKTAVAPIPRKYLSRQIARLFSSESDKPPILPSEGDSKNNDSTKSTEIVDESRTVQAKGATIAYFRSTSKLLSDRGKESIWNKIKKDIRFENVNVDEGRSTSNSSHGSVDGDGGSPGGRPRRKPRARPPISEDEEDEKAFGAVAEARARSRRRGGGDSDEDEAAAAEAAEESTLSDRIPPGILAGLEDIDSLVAQIRKKDSEIDMDDFSRGEKFLAEMIYQCARTEDGVYRDVFTSNDFPNIQIPRARSASTLLRSTVPDLTVPADTLGFEVGSTAWQVLSKNFYFTEADCKYMASMSAVHTNKILDKAASIGDGNVDL